MIQASELRIGNLVYHLGEVLSVTMIGEFGIQSKNDDQTINAKFSSGYVESIPLTEEWLLKFGFEKNERDVHEMHPWIDYTLKGIRIQLPYFTFNFGDEDEQDIDIHYVHQLQNLYFALTGQELEVK